MDTSSGLFFYLTQQVRRLDVSILLVALALMAAAFVGVILAADLLGSASEPIVSAPFRWCSHSR